jgi:hypothetical protein
VLKLKIRKESGIEKLKSQHRRLFKKPKLSKTIFSTGINDIKFDKQNIATSASILRYTILIEFLFLLIFEKV